MKPPAHTAEFRRQLAAHQGDRAPRAKAWVFVPYDQLSAEIGPLAEVKRPGDLGIIMLENFASGRRRRYHRQKLALLAANMRHFALEQAAAGRPVHYAFIDEPYAAALARLHKSLGPICYMEPAEHELRADLADLPRLIKAATRPEQLPHAGWLSTAADFAVADGPPWRMDRFYRHLRQKSALLMRGGKPEGGKYSHDADNRRRWPGAPSPPAVPTFHPDAVTLEACRFVETHYADHPGNLEPRLLPATQANAERSWAWAKRHCLVHFGPYEDAMSAASRGLFHTRISGLMNIHRLLPSRVVAEAAALPLPLSSKEGFVRQILGWREFVRHVHQHTDGLKKVPTQNFFAAEADLPPAFWGKKSGMACLDEVVAGVWDEAYSHHITRLMVLCNIATLLQVDPRQTTDWFWVAYIDAYDWVVEPNVLGMGVFALGDLMMTKPYICGASYINRMSDFCAGCAFDPKRTCPITPMYWAHLARHQERLADNHRMAIPLMSLKRRSPEARQKDAAVLKAVQKALAAGELAPPAAEAPPKRALRPRRSSPAKKS